MSNLKVFFRKNLASVIVLVALVLIAGVALVTKFSVNADTVTTGVGAEVNYADEDATVADAGQPVATMETFAEALSTASATADGGDDPSQSATATASTSATATASTSVSATTSGTATVTATGTATPSCVRTVTITPSASASVTATVTTTTVAAECTVSPTPTSTSAPVYKRGLKGVYFKDKTLTNAVLARLDARVNFDWANASPATNVPTDGFSVRWTGYITPKYTQTYTFKLQHNDGVKLYINNQAVINKWTNNTGTEMVADTGQIALVANTKYPIRIDYYDDTATAAVKFLWSSQSQAEQIVPTASLATTYNPSPANGTGNGLTGAYFNGIGFNSFVNPRLDARVNFTWSGVPMNGVNADNFSTVWTGQVQPKFSEVYTFYVKSSEGVRLWVNGVRIINKWVDQATPTENYGAIRLAAGRKYNIRLQYYEKTGTAESILMWSSPSQRKQVIPKLQMYSAVVPTPTPTVSTTGTQTAAPTVTPSKTPLQTATVTPSVTVTPARSVLIKNGFNTFVLPNTIKLVDTSIFTSQGMKVYAFNRDGSNAVDATKGWLSDLVFFNHNVGYYIYNPGADKTIEVRSSTTITQGESATSKYVTKGWNLIANSGSGGRYLKDMKFYLSSDCYEVSGVTACRTIGERLSLTDLFNSGKAYGTMFRIKDGSATTAAAAFETIIIDSNNSSTGYIMVEGTPYWIYIF